MSNVRLKDVQESAEQDLATGQYSQSAQLSRHILAHYPKHLGAHLSLARSLYYSGNLLEARRLFDTALQFDPESTPALIGKAKIFECDDELDSAMELYRLVLDVAPSLRPARERILDIRQQTGTATGVRLKVSQPGLARLYASQGLLAQAVNEYVPLVKSDPDRLDLKMGLAEANWMSGQRNEAADVCTEVLMQDPDCLKANLVAGIVAAMRDKREEADQRLAQARQVDPDDRVLRQLLESWPEAAERIQTAPAATIPEPEGLEWRREVGAPPPAEAAAELAGEAGAVSKAEEIIAEAETPFGRDLLSLEQEIEEERVGIDISWLEDFEAASQEGEAVGSSGSTGILGEESAVPKEMPAEKPLEELLAEAEAVSREIEEDLALLEQQATEAARLEHEPEPMALAEEARAGQAEEIAPVEEGPLSVEQIAEAYRPEEEVVAPAAEVTVEQLEAEAVLPEEVLPAEEPAAPATMEAEVAEEAVQVAPAAESEEELAALPTEEAIAPEVAAAPEIREPVATTEPQIAAPTPEEVTAPVMPTADYLKQTRELAAAGKMDDAVKQYRALLKSGTIAPEQVISEAKDLLAKSPENLPAHKLLGEAYLAANSFDEAIAELTWYPLKQRKKRR